MAIVPTDFWVIDVEGSGASPPEIIELAAVEVRDLHLTGVSHCWRVRPSTPISRMATSIHGIRNEDVAGCPPFQSIASEIEALISGSAIAGHNVHVEVAFLSRVLPSWRPTIAVDTMRLAKGLMPGLESYGLSRLGQNLSLSEQAQRLTGMKHHSAPYDATLSALLLINLLRDLPETAQTSALLAADIFDQRQGSLL
jgi:DNA polymerase III subunit epsilon